MTMFKPDYKAWAYLPSGILLPLPRKHGSRL